MRILEINKFYNAKRGADKHFLDVSALLKQNGHMVAEFSMMQADNEYSEWSKFFLSRVGYSESFTFLEKMKGVLRMFYSFEAHKKIKAILDEFAPDIVHIHNIYHQLDPTILFEIKKRGIPVVMTVHDFKLINPNHSLRLNGSPYRRCANRRYYQCFLDKCVKNSYAKSFLAMAEMYWHSWLGTYEKNIDCYIAPSEFTKRVLVDWGISSEKILMLPHFMPRSRGNLSRKVSFSVADKFALYAGKISKEKGVDILIEIFTKIDGMKLYLAGEMEPGFAMTMHPNIVYLGFVGADELAQYMRSSMCVVSGSMLPETFGLVALEAISAGKPFVSFDSGAYGEIIEHGISGFIAKSKKEFSAYVKQIASGEKVFIEQEIKARLDKYAPERYAHSLAAIFSETIVKNEEIKTDSIAIDKP